MHCAYSPPALEESPGGWGASKRPSGLWVLSAGGKYHAVGSYRKAQGVERVLVSRTWGVGFLVLYQQGRGCLQNPLIQPHILFSSRRKENVPLTVQEKRRSGEPQRDGSPSPEPPAERSSDGCLVTLLTATTVKMKRTVPCFGTVLSIFGLT